MRAPLPSFVRILINSVIPPRPTERVVEQMRIENLYDCMRDGSLSYGEEAVKALIWELKYHANPKALRLAGTVLSEALLAIAEDEIGKPLLIPVPMHAKRRKERGHNQTELLCEAALPHIGGAFTYAPNVLVRTQHKAPQQTLGKRARLRNMEHTMQVLQPKDIAGRVCVVVDDVSTTGATLAEARRALESAQPRRIITLTLARS